MDDDKFLPSLSVQAHTLAELATKGDRIREQVTRLCSELGLLTQEYYIIGEAMRETLRSMNGGVTPLPLSTRHFPELSQYDLTP